MMGSAGEDVRWTLRSDAAEVAVSEEGGALFPARFRVGGVGGRWVQPLHAAPWSEDPHPPGTPRVASHLRGDFFCLPFGGPEAHGPTASGRWAEVAHESEGAEAGLTCRMRVGTGEVEKRVHLRPGHAVVYQRHRVRGLAGPQSFGHHAMLACHAHGRARVSLSPFVHGRVLPEPLEVPPRGRSALAPGAAFDSLAAVPLAGGGVTDAGAYPARAGAEDLLQVFSDPAGPGAEAAGPGVAWSCVAFPDAGFAWFSLREPRVLTGTVLWFSNGGRLYPPWSGRHRGVLGVEDVTSLFNAGRGPSAAPNAATRAGLTTALPCPLEVRYAFGVFTLPPGAEAVRSITPAPEGGRVEAELDTGERVHVPVDVGFLRAGQEPRPRG